ncbi:MAG: (d)CMP kinase [Bacteroidia bacterium]
MNKINIAIDGYSSCGKSTIAKALAAELGYTYIDTGAMYRSVALFALRNGLIKNGKINTEAIVMALPDIHVSFQYNNETKVSDTYLNGENVEKAIRQMEVSEVVSKVSAIKEVREKMVALQKEMGKKKGVVMDGRDIGTNVFPDAELKIFMTADMDVRVARRYFELTSKGEHVTEEDVKQNLLKRDYDDIHRKENPLKKADDAIVLDNSELTKQQQLDFVIRLIKDLQLIKDYPETEKKSLNISVVNHINS